MLRIHVAGPLFVAALALPAQSPLTTTFAANVSGTAGGAIYFDITVLVPQIAITRVDLHGAAASGTLDILTITGVPGTRAGNQTNLAAWDGPLSLGNPVTTAGFGVPAPCVLTAPLVLPAGTYGMAFRANGFGLAYSYGTGSNQSYTNAELAMQCGEASNVAFMAPLFAPRVVNCSIHYTVGGNGVLATRWPYGSGCVRRDASFYEHFPTTPSIDLSNSAFRMLNTGTSYVVQPSGSAFVPPSGAAINLDLDDDATATVNLAAAMPYPGGTATQLTVCSNGFVSTGDNGADYRPSPAAFLAWPHTVWSVWRDFAPELNNPATGAIWFEQQAGVARVTWNAVVGYAGTTRGTVPSTFQFQFDLATGNVDFVFLGLDTVSVNGFAGGEGWVVGYSPGGPSSDPGSVDLTAAIPAAIVLAANDVRPLALAASARPVAGTTIDLVTNNIGPTAPFGAVLLSLLQIQPGASLQNLGMPTCFRYQGGEVTLLFLPGGLPVHAMPLLVPNVIGVHIYGQSFVYDPAAGLTPLGAIASNGIDLRIGDV